MAVGNIHDLQVERRKVDAVILYHVVLGLVIALVLVSLGIVVGKELN